MIIVMKKIFEQNPEGVALFFLFKSLYVTLSGFAFCVYHFL